MHLSDGSRLGPYEILGFIGAGGMGEVYRARDTRLGREVAIKILSHRLTADPAGLARFEREARGASALNHRNIVTIHDFTSSDGEAWLVMELIRGESLRSAVWRGAMPLKRTLSIASGIADGLSAAHTAGLIHRDLKPENVMIAADGTPKILDFGLVKVSPDGASDPSSPTAVLVTQSGAVVGTVTYMSPEQARGEAVDHRTDQFCFGLMLHEMLTGQHPFNRTTQIETMAAILNVDYELPEGDLPEPLAWMLERCLAKDPADRYASTADLAHDLARLRDGRERSAISTRKPASSRWRTIAISMAVVAAVACAVLALRIWPRKAAVAFAAPVHSAIPTPGIAQVSMSETAVPIALSPNGRYLVIYGRDGAGRNGLWLRDLQSGTLRQIAENAHSAGWSPDSKTIAYFADRKLKTVPVDGGPPTTVCDAEPEGTPSWGGDTILYTQYSRNPGIYRVNASGGKPVRLDFLSKDHGRDGSVNWWPSFLPDGERFLFLAFLRPSDGSELGHELYLGSLDGTSPKRIMELDSRTVFVDGRLLYVRDGALMAQPFDPDAVRLTGEAKQLADDVHYFRGTGLAAFSASENGVLAWRSARHPVRLVWLDRAGMELQQVATGRFRGNGRLSPDGTRYVAGVVDAKLGAADLWIYDLPGQSAERVTFRDLDENAPVWAADGSVIYRSDGNGPPDIFRWSQTEAARRNLLRWPGVQEPEDVSPDGKWLLFITTTSAAGPDLFLLPLEPPGPPEPFLVTPFNEALPRFSPDGRWVAYSADASGRPEVYIRSFRGSTETTRISRDGGTRPVWRKDGTELFFLASGGRFMTVSMREGIPGAPRMLFQAPSAIHYDVAADGSKFLVQLEERSTEPVVQLLVNWPARLGGEN